MNAHNTLNVYATDTFNTPDITGSSLDAIFEQARNLLQVVGPAALEGMRQAEEREAASLAQRMDVSPRRLAIDR